MNADCLFFHTHAGFSWDPTSETPEQGRIRCAENLAAAEFFGRVAGLAFDWSLDPDIRSSEWDENTDYELWQCLCYDSSGNVCQSLGGIDFGDGGEPWDNNYRRVVEAELSAEHMAKTMGAAV